MPQNLKSLGWPAKAAVTPLLATARHHPGPRAPAQKLMFVGKGTRQLVRKQNQ